MPSIQSLPSDIYKAIEDGITCTAEERKELGEKLANAALQGLGPRDQKATLRMSNIGTPCDRKLWYTVNAAEEAEPLDGKAKFKFTYGHLVDALMPFLIRKSGHTVTGEQDRLEVNGIVGHRDAVVDGVVVDVKSASSRGMHKFEKHKLEEDDPFGYLDQLNMYLAASSNDPLVEVKGEAAFIAVDKEMGNIVVDRYKKNGKDYAELVEEKKDMVASPDVPKRRFLPQADGASGNYKLGTECSYCPFKRTCWPGLRTFIYSSGPRYLTQVKRTPDVPEIM